MYSSILIFHSLFRWLVLLSLLLSIFSVYWGCKQGKAFTSFANKLRHWTATIAHVQLMIGITLYFQSPLIKLPTSGTALTFNDQVFFKYVHLGLMVVSVILITIGSAKAKRMPNASAQYYTMLIWFSVALLLILIAIPWPFSPLAARPYIRTF